MRVSIYSVPNDTSQCGLPKWCVYRDGNGWCEMPRTAKGNSDAACHKLNNAKLIAFLEPLKRGE